MLIRIFFRNRKYLFLNEPEPDTSTVESEINCSDIWVQIIQKQIFSISKKVLINANQILSKTPLIHSHATHIPPTNSHMRKNFHDF